MEVDQPVLHPPVSGVLSEVTTMYQPYVEKLYDKDMDVVGQGCKEIKDLVIGNNKQKTNFIVLGAVRRFVYLLNDENTSGKLMIQCATILGSLAKGIDANVQNLIDMNVVPAMCKGLNSSNLKYYEACIRCLRTIIISSNAINNFNPEMVMPQILENINRSTCTQLCACEIISHCFKTTEQQNMLLGLGAVGSLTNLVLMSDIESVKVKALHSLAVLSYRNAIICQQIADTKFSDLLFVDFLIDMLARNQSKEMQLNASKCLTYMFRTNVIDMRFGNGVIEKKVLPCLIRMCSMSINEKINGAKTVAYLTEENCYLQRLSYICDQYPLKLESFFKNPTVKDTKSPSELLKFKQAFKYRNELRAVGFLGYASLLSNDEDLRKNVAHDCFVKQINEALGDADDYLRISALKCLLSLSRSVHMLRTCIQDAHASNSIFNLLKNSNKCIEETTVLSAILANFTLEFCPGRDELIECNATLYMCEWTASEVASLRLNAIWGLLNITFKAHAALKIQILEALGFERIRLLLTDDNREIIIKTLGFLRNMLANSKDSNVVMEKYGQQIVLACQFILETISNFGTGNPALHEEYETIRMHTICVLSCAAAYGGSYSYLIPNEDLLMQIVGYLGHFHLGLQKATLSLIFNLVKCTDPGAHERQDILTRLNILSMLEQLKSTPDQGLSDLIDKTLQQFQGES